MRLSPVSSLLMTCFLAMALAVLLLPLPAAAATYTLSEKDSGRTVTLRVGDQLLVNLRNPGDGGYAVLPPVFDHKILTFLSRQDIPPPRRPTPLMGDFGRIAFTWEARTPGETDLTVNIARPWEKTRPPEQFLRVHILVNP